MDSAIYLDHHATTPLDPRVLDAMMPYFSQRFGNAASRNHVYGWEAEEAVETARETIAKQLGTEKNTIVFTSGATEANNAAIKGVAEAQSKKGCHIITSKTEHKSVLDSCQYLEQAGFRVTYLDVDGDGFVDSDVLGAAITGETILVSVMLANNEIGTIQNVSEIGKICRERNIVFHSDIAQAFGKIPIDLEKSGIGLASISAHKLYGPKGIGVLYVRRRSPRIHLAPQIHGGGHENGFRSGTLNVPGIVGLAKAAEICAEDFEKDFRHISNLRNLLWSGLKKNVDIILNGPGIENVVTQPSDFEPKKLKRLPGNLNVSFPSIDGEGLIMAMKDIAVSTGSACSSANPAPSHVLTAIGRDKSQAKASIRFGIGRWNTEKEIDYVIHKITKILNQLNASKVAVS